MMMPQFKLKLPHGIYDIPSNLFVHRAKEYNLLDSNIGDIFLLVNGNSIYWYILQILQQTSPDTPLLVCNNYTISKSDYSIKAEKSSKFGRKYEGIWLVHKGQFCL